MPIIKTQDLAIYYEATGDIKADSSPVLFIGGTGGDLRSRPNVMDGPLPASMTTIAYDQRGLGQTEKPQGPYTMAQYADDAVALLDALSVDRAHVIGVSFGGMVAQHLALRHAARIDKLVLCCTSSGGEYPSYPFHELEPDISPEQRLRRLMGINDLRRDQAWQAANPDKIDSMLRYTREHAIADHGTEEFKRGARAQVLARAAHDVTDRLSEIAIPTLICAGKYDGIAPVANQQVLKERLPNASLRWFEGGHMFMVQDKRALKAVIEFLKPGD